MKEEIIKKIDKLIKESKYLLAENNTTYEQVLNNEDTSSYDEDSENNNFSAGRISAFLFVKELLEDMK